VGLLNRVIKNPITRKRLLRLKEMKRAYISLWIITILYITSFGAELICNDTPLYVKYSGRSYFTVFKFYPDDTFTGSGKQTRPDYHSINDSANFTQDPENYMIFPPIAFGPYASVDPDSIDVADVVRVRFNPVPMIGTVNIRQDFTIARSASFGPFINKTDKEVRKLRLTDYFSIPETIRRAIGMRFKNESAAAVSAATKGIDGQEIIISLSTYSQRTKPSKTVRLTFTERVAKGLPGADQVF
jgi:microcin C transport system permease protein